MRKLLILLLLAATAFGGWYFGSPLWTVYQIGEAAKARDSERLAAYVDFPALRESFKAELRARRPRPPDAGRLAALRERLAAALRDRAVDAMVNPTMLRLMLGASEPAANLRPPFRLDPANAELVREDFDRFSIRAATGGALVFERRGLSWRIAGVRLPPARPAPQAAYPASNAAIAAIIAG